METLLMIICALIMVACMHKANQLNGKCASKSAGFGLMVVMIGDVVLMLDVLYRHESTLQQVNQTMGVAVLMMIVGYLFYQINANQVSSKKAHKTAR